MKILPLIVISVLLSKIDYAQEQRTTNSFVIAINDKVAISSIARMELIVNKSDTISVIYRPGYIVFNDLTSKNKIYSDTVKELIMKFDNYTYVRNKQSIENYNIKLNSQWFKYSFIVLRIYDSYQKKSKGNISSETGNYHYNFDFPGYSMLKK